MSRNFAEEDGQSLHRHEEVNPGGQPATASLVDPAPRHDVVHVRVVLQCPAPRVQHAEEAEAIGAHKSRVRGQGCAAPRWKPQTARRRSRADGFGPVAAQLGRQREGDQEVGARQQAVGLLLEPGFRLVVLAGRAMPIAARSADRVDLPAGLSGVEHGAEFACAARGDRVQHLLVLPGHGGAEPLEILPRQGSSACCCILTTVRARGVPRNPRLARRKICEI